MKTYKLKSDTQSTAHINLSNDLNEEQLKVIKEGDGPCLVLAGAGSGKTRTITYRVAYLLSKGVHPANILLLTFTNKASREMLSRVEYLLGKKPSGLWGGTFHHVANRVLRKYAPKVGFGNNFTILDQEDSRSLIKVCIADLGIDLKKRRFPSPAVIQNIISYSSNAQSKIEETIKKKYPDFWDRSVEIANIAATYKERKKQANAMDFDDLMLFWLELLNNEEIKIKLATQFKYILVDEYQDTNTLQAALINHLASVHNNILVVGDDAQSIYSFRAADIKNILNFSKIFPDTKTFKLEANYRSTPEILELANSSINHNVNQFEKKLFAKNNSFVKPSLVPAASRDQEAIYISQMILELREEGMALDKIAVLFRAAHHSRVLEFELAKRDIPYDFRGGIRFFERAHIKDVIAYLKIINNPREEVAWLRVLNLQQGIGPVTASTIFRQLREAKDIKQVVSQPLPLPNKASIGWSQVVETVAPLVDLKDPAEIIPLIADSYKTYLEAEYPNWQERLDDISELAIFADQYDDLDSFLAEITLQEMWGMERNEKASSNEERIVLSTIHQAKGLEWDAVFVINLVESQFPNKRALEEENGLEEERRLFYVALTRARKQLFLTYPQTGGYDAFVMNTPSQFLSEVPKELFEETALESDDGGDGLPIINVDDGEGWHKKEYLKIDF